MVRGGSGERGPHGPGQESSSGPSRPPSSACPHPGALGPCTEGLRGRGAARHWGLVLILVVLMLPPPCGNLAAALRSGRASAPFTSSRQAASGLMKAGGCECGLVLPSPWSGWEWEPPLALKSTSVSVQLDVGCVHSKSLAPQGKAGIPSCPLNWGVGTMGTWVCRDSSCLGHWPDWPDHGPLLPALHGRPVLSERSSSPAPPPPHPKRWYPAPSHRWASVEAALTPSQV